MTNRKKLIYIVEDEEQTRDSLSILLKSNNFDVKAADNGVTAKNEIVKLHENTIIDLLIVDIQLPGQSGIDLIDQLSKRQIRIPILVITGFGNKTMLIELLHRGCQGYIDKPFRPERIIEKVNTVINQYEADRETGELRRHELRRDNEMTTLQVNKIDTELKKTAHSYQALINTIPPNIPVAIDYKYIPLSFIGGDFFFVNKTRNGCQILLVDISGHDLGVSFYTILVKDCFMDFSNQEHCGEHFLYRLNNKLLRYNYHKISLTALWLEVNEEHNSVEIINAGYPGPVVMNDGVFALPRAGNVLGLIEDPDLRVFHVPIHNNMKLYAFSDGLIAGSPYAKADSDNDAVMKSPLKTMFEELKNLNTKECVEECIKRIMVLQNYKQSDDILLIGLEFLCSSREGEYVSE